MDLGLDQEKIRRVYDLLLETYGPQGWWPGDGTFEVMVGAVLTQNTAWRNVERAMENLKREGLLDAVAIAAADEVGLAELLRPSGYFNVKARRLQSFCRFLVDQGGEAALARHPTGELRRLLLAVNGIGPETADDMLLYGFERPVFVIDAYTRRLFARLGAIRGDEPYEQLREGFEAALDGALGVLNEYHALIVRHAKEVCRKTPDCAGCGLSRVCDSVS